MPLPIIVTTTHTLTLPSTGKEIKYRPFLVKEEKLLLIASQSEDEKMMMEAVGEVVTNCCITPVKLEELAIFDLEYIFLHVRAKSVGEIVNLKYQCRNLLSTPDPEDETLTVKVPCGNTVEIPLNLEEVEVEKNDKHITDIPLTDTIGIKMKYPNIPMAKRVANKKEKETIMESLDLIAECVQAVWDGTNVYTEFTKKELVTFIENLTQSQFEKMETFFETMPKLRHKIQFNCNKCGYHEEIVLEGLASFFV